jgi:hypothetical protein
MVSTEALGNPLDWPMMERYRPYNWLMVNYTVNHTVIA